MTLELSRISSLSHRHGQLGIESFVALRVTASLAMRIHVTLPQDAGLTIRQQ